MNQAIEVQAEYRGVVTITRHLCRGHRRGNARSRRFVVGAAAGVDAPLAEAFAPGGSFALVSEDGANFHVNTVTPMSGEVTSGGESVPLWQYVAQRGASFPMPHEGRIRIDAGASRFFISTTSEPRALPVRWWTWRWEEQKFTVGAVVALGLFLLMLFTVPPDPRALSWDSLPSGSRLLEFVTIPKAEKPPEVPAWLKKQAAAEGPQGKSERGPAGKAGKDVPRDKGGHAGIKGPQDNPDPQMAKQQAEDAAKDAGILGTIRLAQGGPLASIFGRDSALGRDADNVVGDLISNELAEAYGVKGLAPDGTGAQGGGTNQATIGDGGFDTIGKRRPGGLGPGFERGASDLAQKGVRKVEVKTGVADVRGRLDKEIIRRTIRRHLNEVKFCYEQELTKRPNLQGRIGVQFTIAPTGLVIASAMQHSTVGNPRVEACVIQAVRRWEFPRPDGGGMVGVTYPFVFQHAGGGG